MFEALIYISFGFISFGIVWYFFLSSKKDDDSQSKIVLATRDAELKAAEDAKGVLNIQLKKIEDERDKAYGMMQDVNAYKELTQNSFSIFSCFKFSISCC